MHTQAVQRSLGITVHPAAVEESPTTRLPPHEDVLSHAPIGNEVDLLIDRAHSSELCFLRVVEVNRLPPEVNRSPVASVRAIQNLDQGALAGAVLADDGVHFARR